MKLYRHNQEIKLYKASVIHTENMLLIAVRLFATL